MSSEGSDAAETVLVAPSLVVLVGPPGAGKSTWAAAHFAAGVVSSDALRALVGESQGDQRASADAFDLVERTVAARMRRRLTTVIDTTGYDGALRAAWRTTAAANGVACVAVLFDVAPRTVRARNRQRDPDARVPARVVDAHLARWPEVRAAVETEPFDRIVVVDGDQAAALPVRAVPASVASPGRAPARAAAPPAESGPATQPAPPAEPSGPPGLRFGLQLSAYRWPGSPGRTGATLREIAAAAERAGFESIWVMDHFRQIPQIGRAWDDMLESWTTLAHLAALTERARLGVLVSGITHRDVVHLGQIAATVDVLSGGRVVCGLGAAWFEAEHRAFGWRFPPLAERYALLEDALRFLPLLWGKGTPSFEGRVLRVPEAMCYPRPLQERLPLLVGGDGEQRTLALAARHADAVNLRGGPDVVEAKRAVLAAHCARFERDAAEIEVTHLSNALVGEDAADLERRLEASRPPRQGRERFAAASGAGTVADQVARYRALAEAGVDTAIVALPDLDGPDAVDRFAAVIAACAELDGGVAGLRPRRSAPARSAAPGPLTS